MCAKIKRNGTVGLWKLVISVASLNSFDAAGSTPSSSLEVPHFAPKFEDVRWATRVRGEDLARGLGKYPMITQSMVRSSRAECARDGTVNRTRIGATTTPKLDRGA